MLRGGGGPPPIGTLSAPVAVEESATSMTWTWDLDDPDHWTLEFSLDGVTSWTFWDQQPGSAREELAMDTGKYYRLIGKDAVETPVTGYSNIVLLS